MTGNRSATAVLDEEFLPIRAKLLEVAAALDRMERADNGIRGDDARVSQLQEAIETLLRGEGGRAEAIQLVFSRPYEDDWPEKFRMTNDK